MPKITCALGVAASAGCLAAIALTPSATATDPAHPDHAVVRGQALDGVCYSVPEGGDHDPKENAFPNEPAYLRSGPSPSCGRVEDVNPNTRLDPFCWVYMPGNGNFWDFERPGPGQISGWINEDHLDYEDWSTVECPDFLRPPSAAATDDPARADAVAERARVLDGAPDEDWDIDGPINTVETANMRTGSGPSCRVVDRIRPSHVLEPYCYVYAPSNGHRWTAVIRYPGDGGGRGWIRNDHLEGNGSEDDCPDFISRPAFLR
jgi:hypothetical protein